MSEVYQRPGWFAQLRTRRLVEIRFDDAILLGLCEPGEKVIRVEGATLPDDVRIVGVEYAVLDGWRVFLESESFQEVPANETPPLLTAPTIYRVNRA